MQIIHMIDDYRNLCQEIDSIGKFDAFKNYTEKYPDFFNGVLKYLYCRPIEDLKDFIEFTDFDQLLKTAEKNYSDGWVDYVIATIDKTLEKIEVECAFTCLIGLEMSNIGGCATPYDWGDEQYLYVGVDRPLNKEFLDLLIPHELMHILRAQKVENFTVDTVSTRMIEEGLASYASLWIHNLDWNTTNIANTLNISEKQAENLARNTDELLNMISQDGNEAITAETMTKYFTAQSEETDLPIIGYYIGLYLTHKSIENGTNFQQLISMSYDKILKLWLS
ncbi:MAG: hypothetical protein J6V37_05535 [Clostridia bacterium]|nr:hypothetical protein [Clostridia bacterium]